MTYSLVYLRRRSVPVSSGKLPCAPPAQLARLAKMIRRDFPADDMIYELHVLRACMAVRDGYAKIEDILPAAPSSCPPVGRDGSGNRLSRKSSRPMTRVATRCGHGVVYAEPV